MTTPAQRPQSAAAARSTTVAPVRTRRPWGYGAAAVALILAGGLLAVFLYNNLQRTDLVFVSAHELDRGDTITATDLTTLAVIPGQQIDAFTKEQAGDLIGKVALVPLPAGGLISSSAIADELPIPAGMALVGLALKPTQMPSVSLRAGDEVVLTTVAQQSAGLDQTGIDIKGTIVATPNTDKISGTALVNVYVSKAVASDLASRAAAGTITLYVAG
ncbi:MAG: SAF domain-containing protein [Protaetiibacter sp.]